MLFDTLLSSTSGAEDVAKEIHKGSDSDQDKVRRELEENIQKMITENATLKSTHRKDIQSLTTDKDKSISEWDGTIADMKKLLSQREKEI